MVKYSIKANVGEVWYSFVGMKEITATVELLQQLILEWSRIVIPWKKW
jgi:hypothetical protein